MFFFTFCLAQVLISALAPNVSVSENASSEILFFFVFVWS